MIAEVPEAGVLFAGDLVSVENHPLLEGGNPLGWVRSLTELERANYSRVIPDTVRSAIPAISPR